VDPTASSRDLFFPLAVFKLFDGEGFILHVRRVFTRIRSGATAVARLDLQSPMRWQCAQAVDSRHDLLGMDASAWGGKPKGFGFYL
jgi:hypothetical protein